MSYIRAWSVRLLMKGCVRELVIRIFESQTTHRPRMGEALSALASAVTAILLLILWECQHYIYICVAVGNRRIPNQRSNRTPVQGFFLQKLQLSEVGFSESFRMMKSDFSDLIHIICSSSSALSRYLGKSPQLCRIPPEVLLAATLYQLMHGSTDREVEDLFGISHSWYSVRKFDMMRAIIIAVMAQPEYAIRFPASGEEIEREAGRWISGSTYHDRRFFFLKGAIGAADGTLSPLVFKSGFNPSRWRCRKGYTAQNILCVFNHNFTLQAFYCGCEGSAYDGNIIDWCKLLDEIPSKLHQNIRSLKLIMT